MTSFWNFGVCKALVLWKSKKKADFFQITYFKESKNMAIEKNLRIMITIYRKQHPSVITGNKKIYRSNLYQ